MNSKLKRPLKFAGIGIALLVLIGVGALLLIERSTVASTWLAERVRDLAATYFVPTIEFESFDLDGADTFVMRDVRFTAPDGTRVLECETFSLTFAEIPNPSKPIAISEIRMVGPTLRLIAGDDGTTTFKGLVPFVKNTSPSEQEQVEAGKKLSDVLAIRSLSIADASFEYDDGSGSPMEISGFDVDLIADPASAPGVYTVAFQIDRAPVLDLDFAGSVNIDTFAATIESLRMTAGLDDGAYGAFPPQIQSVLKQADARGAISLSASGRIDPGDFAGASTLDVEVDLSGLNVAAGEYRYPIDRGTVKATLASGQMVLEEAFAESLSGRLDVTGGRVDLTVPSMPASATVTVRDARLQELLRTPTEEPPIAGTLTLDLTVNARLADLPSSLSGPGSLAIREGNLVRIPVITKLAETLDVLGQARGRALFQDRVDATFSMNSTGVEISESEAVTRVLAARATGTIGYAGTLDLVINAGPLEKIQDALGQVGNILGSITDRLVRYTVTGSLGEPRIGVQPGGVPIPLPGGN